MRQSRPFVVLRCAIMLGCVTSSTMAPGQTVDDSSTIISNGGAIAEERPFGRRMFGLPALPPPIRARDIEVWSWLLVLDDEQIVSVKELFDRHEQTQTEVRLKNIRPLFERSADIYDTFPPGTLESSVALSSLIKKERAEAVKKLEQCDNALFQSISALLTEEQLPRLARVKAMRHRAIVADGDWRHPGSGVDILLLLHNVMEVHEGSTVVDEASLDALIGTYGDEMSFAVDKRIDAQIECRTDGSILQKESLSGLVNANWARDRLQQMRRRRVLAEERMHDINIRYLEHFGACVDEETFRLLTDLWRINVYAPVYPDPTNIDDLFETVLGMDDLEDQVRDQVANLRAASQKDRDAINAKMVERLLAYRKEFGIEWPGDAYQKYEPEIIELHAQRITLAKQQIEWLHASVPADVWDQIATDAASHVAEMDQYVFIPDLRRGDPNAQ